jgi:iron complex outermembrane receptor protein
MKIFKPLLRVCMVLAVLICQGMTANALEAEKIKKAQSQAVDLGEITVMAAQPGVEITSGKTVITMDKFIKPGSMTTVTDVLTQIGGVDVQRSNALMASPGDEVSIRGLNEGRMVIEIDGRRINQTGHMGRYIVDWSTLTLDDVDRIEIIRGGHSVLHPFAIGGVINIITKKGGAGDKMARGSVKAGYGRYNTYNLAASIDGSANKYMNFHFSGANQESDGYLRNNFQKTKSLNGHLDIHLPNQAALELSVKHSDVEYGMPVINDPNDTNPEVAARYDSDYPVFTRNKDQLRHLNWPQLPGADTPEWEKHTTYLDAIFRVPAGPGTIKVHGFMTDGRRWTSLYNKSGAFSRDEFMDDRTQGMILEYGDVSLLDNHVFTFGLEYQELGQPSGTRTIYRVKSGYAQDVITLGDRWSLTPGIRYYQVDKATYYSWMEMGYSAMPPGWPFSVANSGKTETDSGFFPSLKLDYKATPDTTLYAAASRSYRLPCP